MNILLTDFDLLHNCPTLIASFSCLEAFDEIMNAHKKLQCLHILLIVKVV